MDASLSAIWAATPVAPWHFAAVYNGAMSESAKPPGRLRGLALSQGAEASLSLRTLVLIRWVAVAGQAATLLVVHYVLRLRPALARDLGGGRDLGGAQHLRHAPAPAPRSRLGDREAALYLAYDTLQLGVLLFLTGGLAESLRHADAGAGDGLGHHPVAPHRHRPFGPHRGGDQRAGGLPPAAAVAAGSALRSRAALRPRHVDGAGVLDLVHRRLHLVGGRGGAAHARRLCRDAAGARARTAHLGGGLARRRRRASIGQPLRHHRRGRQGAGARAARRTAPMPRTRSCC